MATGCNAFAAMAKTALDAYRQEHDEDEYITDKNVTVFLLASLRHLCDARGWDFAVLDKRAYGMYRDEVHDLRGPATLETSPQTG